MNRYFDHLFKSTYIDMFFVLYELAPDGLKKLIEKTKKTKQSPKWHPEGRVFTHIRLVVNRLHNTFNDVNQTLAGFFHDIGKIETTKFDTDKETYNAHGHEDVSVEIVEQYKDWIKERDGDVDIVRYIVKNHMRYKFMDEMRLQILINFVEHPYFDDLNKFSTADFGGTSKKCKDLPDNSDLFKKIEQAKKENKIKKAVRDKFNGNMVILQHPDLKGIELGKAIGDFKKQSDDFTWYVLNSTSLDILKDFNEFLNK